jgi:SAM-dependent methyltransferase
VAKPQVVDWYDYPQYFDLAFASETADEIAFLTAAFEKYATRPVGRVVEAACGSGRLIEALARRKFETYGFDANERMLEFTAARLRRKKLSAKLWQGDMASFKTPKPVDAVVCTFNSFRHLLTESEAKGFLQSAANALRPGGLLILGLHLLPDDASDESCERWTALSGKTRLTATLRVLSTDRPKRLETLRLSLLVRKPSGELRIRSDFTLRRYNAKQFQKLLSSEPRLELCDTFDFWYELDSPLALDDEMSDTVVVLRKRS